MEESRVDVMEVCSTSNVGANHAEKDTLSTLLDAYDYTKRDEFTSEKFKLELSGLPNFYALTHLKKLLNISLSLKVHKIKPIRRRRDANSNIAYLNFADSEAKEEAAKVLQDYKWKKGTFKVKDALPAQDPFIVKNKCQKTNFKLNSEKLIEDIVIPLSRMSYREQLKEKEQICVSFLKKYTAKVLEGNRQLRTLLKGEKLKSGIICETADIVPSPKIDAYRNKNEFTIGVNPLTQKVTVGFRLSSYKDGSVHVGSIDQLRHIPSCSKQVVQYFEKYLDTQPYRPFNPVTHEGVWKQLTVRTSETGEILIITVVHPQTLNCDELSSIKSSIVNFFVEGEGMAASVTSIYYQSHGVLKTAGDIVTEHLWGSKTITEIISGYKFHISPESFIQINTTACECLYGVIDDLIGKDASSETLYDICCGTGTIGICLAKNRKEVIGIEALKEAVENAETNAEENGVCNAKFLCGKVEDIISHVLDSNKNKAVAVLDPPRAGVHQTVINRMRQSSQVHKLVYVSCNPVAAMQNLVALTRRSSSIYKGDYFIPVKAVPVDLFPHTKHFELIILFERQHAEKDKAMESSIEETSELDQLTSDS